MDNILARLKDKNENKSSNSTQQTGQLVPFQPGQSTHERGQSSHETGQISDAQAQESYEEMTYEMVRGVQHLGRGMEHLGRSFGHMAPVLEHTLQQSAPQAVTGGPSAAKPLVSILKHPTLADDDVTFEFDTRAFEPEEIRIKTIAGLQLQVKAKHGEGCCHEKNKRTFEKCVDIPDDVRAEDLRAWISENGTLNVSTARPKSPIPGTAGKEAIRMKIKHEKF